MRLAISSWSFKRVIGGGALNLVEFINVAKERYGVECVELGSNNVKSILPAELEIIKKTLAGKKMELLNILCEADVEGRATHMYDPDPEMTEPNMNMVRRWMRVCQKLEAKAMRVHSGGEIVEERIKELERIHKALGAGEEDSEDDTSVEKTIMGMINGFRRVVFTAQMLGITLLLENHNGFYGSAEVITRVLTEINQPNIKAYLVIDKNTEELQHSELKKVIPQAHMIRMKTCSFDQGGNETTIKMDSCIQTIKEANFNGVLCVEYDGEKDEYEGTEKSIALIKKLI